MKKIRYIYLLLNSWNLKRNFRKNKKSTTLEASEKFFRLLNVLNKRSSVLLKNSTHVPTKSSESLTKM